MNIGRIDNPTRVLGAPADWDATKGECGAMAIRDEPTTQGNSMVSHWYPTAEEIAKLQAGAPVELLVLGVRHPPVMITVGEPKRQMRLPSIALPAPHRPSA